MSRRVLLVGAAAAGAAALAGCSSRQPTASGDTSSPTVLPTSTGLTTAPASSADRDTVSRALADEQTALEVYRALARRHGGARARIAPLITVQRRHVDALASALELGRAPSAPTVDVLLPLAEEISRTAMRAAQARLADCDRAVSGSLASMLASMSASHRVVASQWAAG